MNEQILRFRRWLEEHEGELGLMLYPGAGKEYFFADT